MAKTKGTKKESLNQPDLNELSITATLVNKNRVYLCSFTNKVVMNRALVRPQLFYEDVEVSDRVISFDQVKRIPGGQRLFDGFNIPLSSLQLWLDKGAKNCLVREEIEFLNQLGRALNCNFFANKRPLDEAYILAFTADDKKGHNHELYHAVYMRNAPYQALVKAKWDELSDTTQNGIANILLAKRYHHKHHLDEFQAFVAESPHSFGKRFSAELYPIWQTLQSYLNTQL